MTKENKVKKKETDYWKIAAITLVFIAVGLIASSLICNEEAISTPIGEIDSLALEQFKDIIQPGEDILVVNIQNGEEMILQGGME